MTGISDHKLSHYRVHDPEPVNAHPIGPFVSNKAPIKAQVEGFDCAKWTTSNAEWRFFRLNP